MTPSDLRERVKEIIANGCGCDRYCDRSPGDVCGCKTDADAAISIVLEEAAMRADMEAHSDFYPMDPREEAHKETARRIAAAIRAMKGH